MDNENTMFNDNASEHQEQSHEKSETKSVEKGLDEDQPASPNEHENSKDSITEYEKIISEKLEQKRKEELKKASESMKAKLSKTGRCPVCTLAPP